jgi:hypothetical protein
MACISGHTQCVASTKVRFSGNRAPREGDESENNHHAGRAQAKDRVPSGDALMKAEPSTVGSLT